MPRLKCPRCATVIDVAPGASPVCPACGFGSGSGSAPSPAVTGPVLSPPAAPPQPGWSSPPSAATYPPGAMPMGSMPRPGWVTFVAVMEFISAGFLLLGGLILAFGGAAFGAFIEQFTDEYNIGVALGAIFIVIGIILLGLGVLALLIGLGLLKGRSWARITAIVFTIIGAVFSVISLLMGDFSSVLTLVLDGLILFALFNPRTKAWFDQQAHMAHA